MLALICTLPVKWRSGGQEANFAKLGSQHYLQQLNDASGPAFFLSLDLHSESESGDGAYSIPRTLFPRKHRKKRLLVYQIL